MTLIECPNPKCRSEVDIDSTEVKKQVNGLELVVKCPKCKTYFLLQRISEVKQKLLHAQYGIVKGKGTRKRVEL
jgi:hypothetical protein